MADRLGTALYALSCGLALLFLAYGAFALSNNAETSVAVILGLVPAVICYLFGRICRFVLSGH